MIIVLDKTAPIMMLDARCDVFTAVVMNVQIFWDANTLTTGKPCIYGN